MLTRYLAAFVVALAVGYVGTSEYRNYMRTRNLDQMMLHRQMEFGHKAWSK